jgi:hypothetical protein
MAYYDALKTQWATLTGTTAQKLAAINAMTVSGSVPTSFYVTGSQVANCINYAEFKALTATQQANLLGMLSVAGNLLGGSGNTAFLVDGMILDYFPLAGTTVANLTALAKATSTPWWQANGYSSPFSQADLDAAGGLT